MYFGRLHCMPVIHGVSARLLTNACAVAAKLLGFALSMKIHDHWSKQLFCALAKRYDLKPYRYRRQRYTTVMLRVPRRFLDEVLWPEFVGLDDVLRKYLDEMTAKIISEAIFKGSAEEEIREQPLIES